MNLIVKLWQLVNVRCPLTSKEFSYLLDILPNVFTPTGCRDHLLIYYRKTSKNVFSLLVLFLQGLVGNIQFTAYDMRSTSSKRIMAHKTVFWVEAKNVYFLI
jgi:hypothetical protein